MTLCPHPFEHIRHQGFQGSRNRGKTAGPPVVRLRQAHRMTDVMQWNMAALTRTSVGTLSGGAGPCERIGAPLPPTAG
jgi:hypothetical protein